MSPDPIAHLVASARESAAWIAEVPFREDSRLATVAARHAAALRHAAEAALEAHRGPADVEALLGDPQWAPLRRLMRAAGFVLDPDRTRAEPAAGLLEAARRNERRLDGGEWGTLEVCPVCSGTGVLHRPDTPPERSTPTDYTERAEWLAAGVLPVDGLEEPERDVPTVLSCGAHAPGRMGLRCLEPEGHAGVHRSGPATWHGPEATPARVDVADLVTRADLEQALAAVARFGYVHEVEGRLLAEEQKRADLEGVVAKLYDSTRTLSDRIDRLAHKLDEHAARGADVDHERAAHPHSLMRPDLPGRVRSLESRLEGVADEGAGVLNRLATLRAGIADLERRHLDLARAVGDRLSSVENITTSVVGGPEERLTTTVVGFTNPEEDDPQRVRLMMDSNAGPEVTRRENGALRFAAGAVPEPEYVVGSTMPGDEPDPLGLRRDPWGRPPRRRRWRDR